MAARRKSQRRGRERDAATAVGDGAAGKGERLERGGFIFPTISAQPQRAKLILEARNFVKTNPRFAAANDH
jgi:hypothetical protein